MATIEVKCPECGETRVTKHGKSGSGEQRYYCKNSECSTTSFQLDHKYNGCKRGIKEQIIKMTSNSSGIRDISRVLKVSTYKVMSTLKKRKI